jgi:signal transduction histidine kinase
MSDILETLMAVARGDAGLDGGRSDVGATLEAVRTQWAGDRTRRPVRLEVAPVPTRLLAGVDREVLERILAPLLDNAGRYARNCVRVEAAARDGGVTVTVADDGPGIPEHARERIFRPGTRADGVNGHGGAGLGLALSRRLARAVGGEVSAQPSAGGALLRVELPR